MKNVIIIGGGPSGMMAAITAARASQGKIKITILERKNRIGKKLLITGNGTCNISNMNSALDHYYGKNPGFVEYALRIFSPRDTIQFFNEIGLLCKTEESGRIYPYCKQAAAVLDCLRFELNHLNIEVVTDFDVSSIIKNKEKFVINHEVHADNIILAAGGCTYPQLGSNGSGFKLLESFRHTVTELSPALVQFKTDSKFITALSGIKVVAGIRLYSMGTPIESVLDEVLFTDYGLSGLAIMQLSRHAINYKKLSVQLDFMAEYEIDELIKLLLERKKNLAHLTMENYLTGLLNKKIGQGICKLSGIEKLSMGVAELTKSKIKEIAFLIKNFKVEITGTKSWDAAQVTAGGVLTGEFNPETMESKKIEGLFAAGEVFDIFGDCGGYNLQWAWSSGFLAGQSAVMKGMHI